MPFQVRKPCMKKMRTIWQIHKQMRRLAFLSALLCLCQLPPGWLWLPNSTDLLIWLVLTFVLQFVNLYWRLPADLAPNSAMFCLYSFTGGQFPTVLCRLRMAHVWIRSLQLFQNKSKRRFLPPCCGYVDAFKLSLGLRGARKPKQRKQFQIFAMASPPLWRLVKEGSLAKVGGFACHKLHKDNFITRWEQPWQKE